MSAARQVDRRRLPLPVFALAMVAIAFFALPFLGLLWRAPWGSMLDVLTQPSVRTALWLSLRTSLTATFLAVVFGVPLAWLLARVPFPGSSAVRALCLLSMVLPPVVGGVALFFSFGRRGLFGQYLDRWFDVQLPFTTWGVVVAQTFVSMPFLVITVEAALRQTDRRYEDAARTLGASRWYVFRRVTIPAIQPALIAGAVLAWARALGEFGPILVFAGATRMRTEVLPTTVFLELSVGNIEAAVAVSLLMIAAAMTVLTLARTFGLRQPLERVL